MNASELEGAMRPVVQLEPTGCGIASVAAIAGLGYRKARYVANALGIRADDERLAIECPEPAFGETRGQSPARIDDDQRVPRSARTALTESRSVALPPAR